MSAIVAIPSANLTADTSVKYTTTGKAVCNFRIAVTDGFGDTKRTYFFNAVAWEDLAEQIGKLTKGQKLGIYGKLTSRDYEKDGQKRSVVEVLVNAVDIRKTDSQKPAARPQTQEVPFEEDIPF